MKTILLFTALLATLPIRAQVNLSGVWSARLDEDFPDRLAGPELGDYGGLPINANDRMRATSWSASLITVPEYQCRVHPSDYAFSFADIRMWEERDRATQDLIAIHIHHFAWGTERTIWMDGRPHPPDYALHTAMGFSTGRWDGDTLTVTTTHLKEGWARRNGIARSDRATVTEHFIRHGDDLTWAVVVSDPVYFTEPLFRSHDYVFNATGQIAPYPCESVTEIRRAKGLIPFYLPGANPFLDEYSINHGIPLEAAMGGAETAYPEYKKKIAAMPKPPAPAKPAATK